MIAARLALRGQSLPDQGRNIDRLRLHRRRGADRHGQCHQSINAASRALLRGLAGAGIIDDNGGVGNAHSEHGMFTVGELALEQLEMAQRRRHALRALAELKKMICDELFAQVVLRSQGKTVAVIPAVNPNLGNV